MKKVLMVAEKPSLADSIANILSHGKSCPRKSNFNGTKVHEWTGTFRNETVVFHMTSVAGHVMTLDFTGKYNNWDRVEPVELFSCTTEKKEAMAKLKIPAFLAHEAKGCDHLVLWLDCDKEGENICFEVIHAVEKSLKRPYTAHNDVVFRAHFSAITEKELFNAMANLGKPNENEAKSVDARQELDLRIGCAFTRFQTKFFQGKYADLDSSFISYGPCQTPTLGFCVRRHDEIQTFKPEPYWVLEAKIQTSDGREVNLSWERVRCFEKEIAQMFLYGVKEFPTGVVISVVSNTHFKGRPQALNTFELMKVGSSRLGMGPHYVMQIAEKLYIEGYISYPRTETTHYPESFDLHGTLSQLQNSADWGMEIKQLMKEGINKPKKGHDAGDHPPITPMKLAQKKDLDNDCWKIYDFIARHFIATVSKDCEYITTTVKISIGTEVFFTSGKTLVSPGYTTVMFWQALSKNEIAPEFQKGEEVTVLDVKMVDCQTCPPDYLTESELISLMEKHGIGTDASIPVHINNIGLRNFVRVEQGRRLIPTTLGIVLVHGYQKIDPELVLPTMRSAVEKQLNLIAQGLADYHSVLLHTVNIFKMKFVYFVKNIEGMDQLFEVRFSTLANAGKPHSRCGKCRRFLKYIQAKPSRLYCPHCDETYNLPQNGMIRTYKELKCPLDDFELVYWLMGSKGKSFPLCPYCYNNPPFEDMKKGSGCNSCQHPSCVHSLLNNGISSCQECDGTLVLDPSSAPKWKMGCNKCDVIYYLFEDATKVSVGKDVCSCGAQTVSIEYKKEKTKLPNKATELTGCIFCCTELSSLVEKQWAVACRPAISKPRGRGRGKAKGKPRQPKDKMAHLDLYFV
ncbi:DNA topoisomerase 3-beta-1 [Cimex lectularius]|uniref:DNA topoisomerase n=1 Tax=Cimex lectularius TaxID=79782 RepID=A0A8I6SA28_CIMLE|nr:DNA topoisomerase 3-beta-1 [Cimex lectularius]